MTNREKILNDCNEAADALLAREAMARIRMHERDRHERNAMALIVLSAVGAVAMMVLSVCIATGVL